MPVERWVIKDYDKHKIVTRKDLVSMKVLAGEFSKEELRGYLVFPTANACLKFIENKLNNSNRFSTKLLK